MPNGVEYLIDPATGKLVLTTAGGTVASPIAGAAAAEGAAASGVGAGIGSLAGPLAVGSLMYNLLKMGQASNERERQREKEKFVSAIAAMQATGRDPLIMYSPSVFEEGMNALGFDPRTMANHPTQKTPQELSDEAIWRAVSDFMGSAKRLPNGNWEVDGKEIESGSPTVRGEDFGTPGIVQTEYPADAENSGGDGGESGGSSDSSAESATADSGGFGWVYPNEEILTEGTLPVDLHTNPDGSTVVTYDNGSTQWGKPPEDFSNWPEETTNTPGTSPETTDSGTGVDLDWLFTRDGVPEETVPNTTPAMPNTVHEATDTTGTGLGDLSGLGGEGNGDSNAGPGDGDVGAGLGEGDTGTGPGEGSPGEGSPGEGGPGEGGPGEGGPGEGVPGDGTGTDDPLGLLEQQTQRTDVKGPEGANIPYVYDWESIFANPMQEAYYTSPYAVDRGMGQRQLMELIASMRGQS